ncbi:PREDICTED: uncharacterized protein LOC109163252 [Ipomoea nil]|uniref:uncharacterized protein LOC109163252 n=1 Tax=Ipomoea nil TaxID=35883 RepID=UPI000900BB27|nr:PREDICTED: uncharacterized protein LOC109163252 [Ipomoea nil]
MYVFINCREHWLLLVINVCSRMVYVLDPLERDQDIQLKPVVNMAFRSYMNQRGQRAKNLAQWKNVKCPQQPGGVECGYYVMKYMHDLCTKYSTYTSLDKVFQDRTTPYSIEEIDEIREMWAKYFCKECV